LLHVKLNERKAIGSASKHYSLQILVT